MKLALPSVRVLAKSLQLCPTLWTVARQAPLSMEFSRQECWSGLPCPPLGDLPNPGIEPASIRSPALARGFFTASVTWEALLYPKNIFHPKWLSLSRLCLNFNSKKSDIEEWVK